MDKTKAFFSIMLQIFFSTAALLVILFVWDVIDFENMKEFLWKTTLTFIIVASLSLVTLFLTRQKNMRS